MFLLDLETVEVVFNRVNRCVMSEIRIKLSELSHPQFVLYQVGMNAHNIKVV